MTFASALLFVLLVATAVPHSSRLSPAASSAASWADCEDCWVFVGAPTYLVAGDNTVGATATFQNNFNVTVTATAYLVIYNSLGQMVAYDPTTGSLKPHAVGSLHPSWNSPLPPGLYSTSVFATMASAPNEGSVPISTAAHGSFRTAIHAIEFTLFGVSSETPVAYAIAFTNVLPVPIQGVLYAFANDTTGQPFSSARENFTLMAGATGKSTLVFPNTQNINECFLTFSFVVRSTNGTSLSRTGHDSSQCYGTPSDDTFAFPTTPLAQMQIGRFQALQTNVTNTTPFSSTVILLATVRTDTGTLAGTASATLTLGAGEVSPAPIVPIGLACGRYMVNVTELWVSPSPPPPGPTFAPFYQQSPLTVC
jgi:hypothetical protein